MTAGQLQNAYYELTAPDGRQLLVIALEYEPRPATVSWANSIAALPEFADDTVLVMTHAYLQSNNTRYTGSRVAADADGEELWQKFVSQHDNIEMTVNGHFGGDGVGFLRSIADGGNAVNQMYLDTQYEANGGDGWIQLIEFLEDGHTVRVARTRHF